MNAIAQVLTGLTWDITDASVGLTSVSAVLTVGSALVGTGATGDTDLSGEWAFKDNVSVVGLGPFGIGAIGDINFGEDTFGEMDIINPALNLFGPSGPNGIDAGLVGLNVDLLADGFASQGPVVQNSMTFTFNVSGNLDLSEITNVQPLFGSNGVAAVPEPSPLALLGCGLFLLGVLTSELKRRSL